MDWTEADARLATLARETAARERCARADAALAHHNCAARRVRPETIVRTVARPATGVARPAARTGHRSTGPKRDEPALTQSRSWPNLGIVRARSRR
jgi:hypothetical protein